MLLKKKLCIGALFCGVLFFMIASHSIQNSFKRDMLDAAHSTAKTLRKTQTQTKTVTETSQHRSCSCTTCIKDSGVSEWFKQRFDYKQEPYLTAEENQIDPDSLKWWLGLQQSANQSISEIIEKMFTVISRPVKSIHQPSQCRKCAVVGNSGNLLQFKYGHMINSHSIVFRMNKAMTSGFEQHVGNKTTHHIMYPESAVDLAPGVHLVLLPFKMRDLEWVTSALSTGEIKRTYMRVKEFVQADKDKVIVVNPSFFKYTHDRWTEHHGRYPSTGMLAIVFALHVCDEISVFGYGADSQGNWHHYWENNKYAGAFRKTGVHSAEFEREIILKLDAEGKIKLYPKVESKAPNNVK
ncbi:ST3 beta-galactoside alpha-2,3-sialyltransferase 8 [Ictalurus furcatus]|uniref:ST3 beta-galactoside alpha-2,3-sialyltransferase 8 n=1 Tax=Ictalurus furcatus TaxID=66913 RepID=UPI0023504E39|nr:ST3 beta-galactoside alpha-2,3-sialyltransferase 8 [Ictalurus furcatus]XP_053508876.1 ST3 beta-galactoside alpha-2,3-sialyltransferase 8 [Ictalurus furcatus]XP_053508877.1 ST3 beta-galactoside alpha-2,3-sialyltransferase 8 [Ictalurus furcatus]XP_053508878.1 ST3 beta-galactoside alpha-2,3-sialyltransferase 8 [Ictalurus furcatus]